MMNDNMSMVRVRAEKGKLVDGRKHPRFELAYVVRGRALHKDAAGNHVIVEGT